MKITERKPAAKGEDLLTTVARSIGSTLGTVARKVRPSSRKSNRQRAKRKTPRKLGTAFINHRQGIAKRSKRRGNPAAIKPRKRKKVGKLEGVALRRTHQAAHSRAKT
jgi:hypothetical protein